MATRKFKKGDMVKVVGSFGKGMITSVSKGMGGRYFYDIEHIKGGKHLYAVSQDALTKISTMANESAGRKLGRRAYVATSMILHKQNKSASKALSRKK